MQKYFFKISAVVLLFLGALAMAQSTKYKCMLQMKNYTGEGAYITAYIINPQGKYVKSLSVMGDDERWYKNLKQWYAGQSKSKEKLDAITGASVSGGKRNVFTVSIDNAMMNKGYKIRFESSVEHGDYVPVELDIPLETATILNRVDGKGYIRFAKLNSL